MAVLDSGIDSAHVDLATGIAGEYHFLGQGADVGPGAPDDVGHGTAMANLITSDGNVAPRGVAPDADILAIKVGGNAGFQYSDTVAALDYVAENKDDYENLAAINISLGFGGYSQCPCDEADTRARLFQAAVLSARDAGILCFVSPSNGGSCTIMPAPACVSASISVGAVSSSPAGDLRVSGDRGPCLDILAPGGPFDPTRLGAPAFFLHIATSYSAPHGTATAALLAQADLMMQSPLCPGLSADEVVEILRETGSPTATNCAASRERPTINAFRAVSAVLDRDAVCFDCNENSVPDTEDLLAGASRDVNSNGIPDECEPDCNSNGLPDDLDISEGAPDCNLDGRPDECERDCNSSGIPDACELAAEPGLDCDGSGTPDECEIAQGALEDCNSNGIPDRCEVSRFPTVLEGGPSTVTPSVFLGRPDGVAAGLAGDAVTFDLGVARIVDGEGSDLSVYEAEGRSVLRDAEFSALDVLVSTDGEDYVSVKSSEQALERVPGDEALTSAGFARSYDLRAAGIADARYLRLQGLGSGPAGSDEGFDLDAVGWIHYRACIAEAARFVRGDCTGDGRVDITDPVCTLNWLFSAAAALPCLAASNVNGDEAVDIIDAVSVLTFLFSNGPPPVQPYPVCGPGALPADETLGCESGPESCQ